MYVLIADDRAGLALRRLRPWHQLLAACQAGRLDHELAEGASPEASAMLAVRAMRLTSMGFRHDLAESLQRIIMVSTGEPVPVRSAPVAAPKSPGAARAPRVPLRQTRISQSARLLADLASRLAAPGPVPVRGVAMVTRLLSEGTGPLYHEASRDDLGRLAERAAQALTL
jgi:hypothetical protein